MGYTASGGPNGLGVFNNTPSTTSDFNQTVTLLAQQGNSRVGTNASRTALTGSPLYAGLMWAETDTGTLWMYTGSVWVTVYGGDTGWQTLTAVTGFTALESPAYRLKNGIVYLRGGFTQNSGAFTATPVTVCTLPSGARISVSTRYELPGYSSTSIAGVLIAIVDPSGSISIAQNGGGAVADARLSTISYPV